MIDEIKTYWDKQSAIWHEEKQEAWVLPETAQWLAYFRSLRSQLHGNTVLEVGTASGYFANILCDAGYEVTAVDLSDSMVEEAKKCSAKLGFKVQYHAMDAQELQLPSNTFDLVFTRLMTWVTPDVERFYRQSFRVLKSGGMFLNFDGDFGKHQFSQKGHEKYPQQIMQQANTIKSKLSISSHPRPAWDVELLSKLGFVNIVADVDGEKHISSSTKGNVDESSLFKISAIKP